MTSRPARRRVPVPARPRGGRARSADGRHGGRAGQEQTPGPRTSRSGHLEWISTIAGAATLIGALLYYFGWARTSATFGHFGIEAEVLELSFQDYLLRSVRSTYLPLLVLAVVAFGGMALHRSVARSPAAVPVGVAFATIGSFSVLVGVVASLRLITFRVDWPLVPAAYLTGVILVLYGVGVLVPLHGERLDGSSVSALIRHPIVACVIVLLAFWLVSTYAGHRGRVIAEQAAAHLETRPAVLVLSEKDLGLHGHGVEEVQVASTDSGVTYCYSGLRLLIRSGGRQFLVPEDWKQGRDPAIVLEETESIRFEYFRSQAPVGCP